jgi:hypothetical protein
MEAEEAREMQALTFYEDCLWQESLLLFVVKNYGGEYDALLSASRAMRSRMLSQDVLPYWVSVARETGQDTRVFYRAIVMTDALLNYLPGSLAQKMETAADATKAWLIDCSVERQRVWCPRWSQHHTEVFVTGGYVAQLLVPGDAPAPVAQDIDIWRHHGNSQRCAGCHDPTTNYKNCAHCATGGKNSYDFVQSVETQLQKAICKFDLSTCQAGLLWRRECLVMPEQVEEEEDREVTQKRKRRRLDQMAQACRVQRQLLVLMEQETRRIETDDNDCFLRLYQLEQVEEQERVFAYALQIFVTPMFLYGFYTEQQMVRLEYVTRTYMGFTPEAVPTKMQHSLSLYYDKHYTALATETTVTQKKHLGDFVDCRECEFLLESSNDKHWCQRVRKYRARYSQMPLVYCPHDKRSKQVCHFLNLFYSLVSNRKRRKECISFQTK